ncbi:MAG: 2-hydroxyacid dehydrogenase, partial [Janthinobacterium lividum]
GAAGLDVFQDEPHPLASLLASQRVMLSPHVGGASEETRAASEAMVLENLASALAGAGVLHPIV